VVGRQEETANPVTHKPKGRGELRGVEKKNCGDLERVAIPFPHRLSRRISFLFSQ
jgi:hypothetical protein